MKVRYFWRAGVAVAVMTASAASGVLGARPTPAFAAGAGARGQWAQAVAGGAIGRRSGSTHVLGGPAVRKPMTARTAGGMPAGQLAYAVRSVASPSACTSPPCTVSNIFVVNADGSGAHQAGHSAVNAANPV